MNLKAYFKKLAKKNSHLEIRLATPDPDYAANCEALDGEDYPPSPLYGFEGKIVKVEDDFLFLDIALAVDDVNVIGIPFGSIAFFQPVDE